MKLIPEKEIIKIPIKDNGERLVCVKEFCPQIIINLALYIKKENKKSCKKATFVRESVAKRLVVAQSNLPKGYRLMLCCGHRTLSIQKKMYDKRYDKLKKENPQLSKEKLKDETSKFIAPVDIVPPHSTGGAIDISIIGPNQKELNMGTKIGTFTEETYTNSSKISKIAKKNRKLLISVMTKAGFVNYPTEWWHWSYGDRDWAAVLKKKYSIYGSI